MHGACVSWEKALSSSYLAPFWDDDLQRMAPFPSLRLTKLPTTADARQFTTVELVERDLQIVVQDLELATDEVMAPRVSINFQYYLNLVLVKFN
eukprot:SAG31_NODE_18788_length_622_cov_1.665392_1_plen_94_part_00